MDDILLKSKTGMLMVLCLNKTITIPAAHDNRSFPKVKTTGYINTMGSEEYKNKY
jgi:hypothetical protein